MFLFLILQYTQVSFVHIPKTGGLAIETWIWKNRVPIKHYPRDTCNTTIWDFKNKRYYGALSRKHCISNYARTPNNWTRFCVVRNPIDRAISSWKYRDCKQNSNRYIINHLILNGEADNHDIPQHDFASYCNIILCFERLQYDFSRFIGTYLPQFENKSILSHINNNRCNSNITLDMNTIAYLKSKYALDFSLWHKTCNVL